MIVASSITVRRGVSQGEAGYLISFSDTNGQRFTDIFASAYAVRVFTGVREAQTKIDQLVKELP